MPLYRFLFHLLIIHPVFSLINFFFCGQSEPDKPYSTSPVSSSRRTVLTPTTAAPPSSSLINSAPHNFSTTTLSSSSSASTILHQPSPPPSQRAHHLDSPGSPSGGNRDLPPLSSLIGGRSYDHQHTISGGLGSPRHHHHHHHGFRYLPPLLMVFWTLNGVMARVALVIILIVTKECFFSECVDFSWLQTRLIFSELKRDRRIRKKIRFCHNPSNDYNKIYSFNFLNCILSEKSFWDERVNLDIIFIFDPTTFSENVADLGVLWTSQTREAWRVSPLLKLPNLTFPTSSLCTNLSSCELGRTSGNSSRSLRSPARVCPTAAWRTRRVRLLLQLRLTPSLEAQTRPTTSPQPPWNPGTSNSSLWVFSLETVPWTSSSSETIAKRRKFSMPLRLQVLSQTALGRPAPRVR